MSERSHPQHGAHLGAALMGPQTGLCGGGPPEPRSARARAGHARASSSDRASPHTLRHPCAQSAMISKPVQRHNI
eukprot:15469919-Alexandrium_andersonii.AAC.1